MNFSMEDTISIIIPAWNEQDIIIDTCNFLRKLKLPFKYSELIFIAGGRDNTYTICQGIKLDNFDNVFTIKQNPGDYKSGALIKGIKKSIGDYIILIDADTLVSSNLVIEIVKSLKKFDAVSCDFLPLLQKGFIYNYHIINKVIWASNPNNLSSLFGGATISFKRKLINEIGVENFFTSKSRAGVDYYMSMVLKRNNKSLGLVKNARVITPRPKNIKDLLKIHNRWYSAFFDLHQGNRIIILNMLILSILFSLFPPIIFLFIICKMIRILDKKYLKIKYFITKFFFEYIESILKITTFMGKLTRKSKPIGHFKGAR